MTKIVNCYNTQLKPKTNKHSVNLRIFNFFIFTIVFSLGFAYLIGISDLTVKGFVLQDLKGKSSSLIAEKIDNEQQIDSIQSYYALNSRAQKLNMVAINDIEYLSSGGHIVAKK
jgi:hypothetical protein